MIARIAVSVLCILTLTISAAGKSCTRDTGHNSTLIIPADLRPTADGKTLPARTKIRVVAPDGECVAHMTYAGRSGSQSTEIWGEDRRFNRGPGIRPGSRLSVQVQLPGSSTWLSGNVAFEGGPLTVTNRKYKHDHLYVIKDITVSGSGRAGDSDQNSDADSPRTGGSGSVQGALTSRGIGNLQASGRYSHQESSGRHIVEGSGKDIWNNSDEFRFAYRSLEGDGEIVARVASLTRTHDWAKAGVMIRGSLSPRSPNAFMTVTANNGTSFQRRKRSGGKSYQTGGPRVKAPYWVKLTRDGNTVVGAVSSNGRSWNTVGRVNLPLDENVYIGLAVTSHDDGDLNRAAFEEVKIDGGEGDGSRNDGQNESEEDQTEKQRADNTDDRVRLLSLTGRDVGPVGRSGSYDHRSSSGRHVVKGSGKDIWNKSDEFQFAHQSLSGDGEIVARVTSITNTHRWAKAGVMIRASLNPRSPHAFMTTTADEGTSFQRRPTAGNQSYHTQGPRVRTPYWVKLERRGSTVIGSVSSDGESWKRVDRVNLPLDKTAYVGLAVTSHSDGDMNRAVFEEVSIEGSGALAKKARASAGSTVQSAESSSEPLTDGYALSKAYPNPFNPQTQFTLQVAQEQRVSVIVYNMLGQRVRVLHQGQMAARKTYRFRFDASDLPSGTYLYVVRGQTFADTQKMLLVK